MIDDIRKLIDAGRHDEAAGLLDSHMARYPDDIVGLKVAARLLLDVHKNAIARAVAAHVTAAAPDDFEGWLLLAVAEAQLQRPDPCIAALHKAEERGAPPDVIWRYLAVAHVTAYRFDKAEYYANKCIAAAPHEAAYFARAYARLHKRRWGAGWDDYHYGLGHAEGRDKHNYGLPEWGGGPGSVLVYGEQGIGDQVAYSSAADTRVRQLVCHPKLERLLARSLPWCAVYGSQFTALPADVDCDYQINMAGLMKFTRRKAEDFPRVPYLRPHPAKSVMYSALLSPEKKRIGIAWTGGTDTSYGGKTRNKTLAELLPILSTDCEFISLQYKSCGDDIERFRDEHGIEIKDWPFMTQTSDMDDVAALIANLDAVVCVPTTAYHIAGALGVPAYVLVHDMPHFHEGVTGRESPWWGSVRFYRGKTAIEEVAGEMRNHYSGRTRASGFARRGDQFRADGGAILARAV